MSTTMRLPYRLAVMFGAVLFAFALAAAGMTSSAYAQEDGGDDLLELDDDGDEGDDAGAQQDEGDEENGLGGPEDDGVDDDAAESDVEQPERVDTGAGGDAGTSALPFVLAAGVLTAAGATAAIRRAVHS